MLKTKEENYEIQERMFKQYHPITIIVIIIGQMIMVDQVYRKKNKIKVMFVVIVCV